MVLTGHEIIGLLQVFFGGGVAVSIVAYAFTKLFGLESGKVIHTMVVGLTTVAAGAQYLLSLKSIPPTVLGVSAPAIYGVSQLVYKGAKAANTFMGEVQAVKAQKASTAAANASVAAVSVPAEAPVAPVANF
jgi:hypothetical protein